MPVRIVLHGECLELPETFIVTHPGGAQLLHQASVLDDATPLFESYHAPTPRGVASLRALARTYKLKAPLDADAEERIARALRAPRYTYTDHGFYADVSRDVRAFFATKTSGWSFANSGSSGRPKIHVHKATPWWLLKSFAILAALVYSAATSFMASGAAYEDNNGGWLSSLMYGILAGALGMSLSFVVMHDASHYAVSSSPLINEALSAVICLPSLWSPTVWLGHHVAGHHSWTGELRHDPDVVHGRPFVRKAIGDRASAYFPQALALQRGSTIATPSGSKTGNSSNISESKSDTCSDSSSSSSDCNSKDVLSSSSGSSSWLSEVPLAAVVVLAAAPGMFVGQSLTYLRAMVGQKERYFGAALLHRGWTEQAAFGVCVTFWTMALWLKPTSVVGCTLGANVTYFVCIAPDHDTYEAAVEDHDEPMEQRAIPSRKAAAAAAAVAAVSPELVAVASAEDSDCADGCDAGDDANSTSSTLKKQQQQQQQQQQASPPKRDWGALQARRSANFATSSSLVCCAFGGINYQVEHHLFPGISHVWYPALSPIVRAACAKHGVPYHATSWFDALRSWCRAIRYAGGGSAASP